MDREVYLLLAQANLLRLRGQHEEAEAKCSEVLSRQRNNASAHSLMGDICRDQQRLRDAIEWYKLALDIEPSSRADREKLQELLDQVYAGGKPTPASGLPEPRAATAPARSYVRRLLAVSELPPSLRVAMVAIVVAVVLMLTALVLAKQWSSTPRPAEEPSRAEPAVAQLPQPEAPALGVLPPPSFLPGAERPASPPEPGTAAPSASTDIVAREQLLLSRVSSAAAASGEPCQLVRTRLSRLQPDFVTISLVVPLTQEPAVLRQRVLSLSLRLCQEAFLSDPGLKEAEVEVDASQELASGEKRPVALFAGRAIRERVAGASLGTLSPDQQETLFSQPTRWLAPELQQVVR
jgi:hypothetical protein